MTVQTFNITTVPNPSGPGAIYQVDGQNRPVLNLVRGGVYTFNQSAVTNANHPIAFKDGAGAVYTVGVVSVGIPGSAGAQTVLTVAANAPNNLRYYCVTHGDGMGNTITVTGSVAIQTINIGGFANDGTGDDLRTAFLKVNSNFSTLGSVSGLTNGENLGNGVGVFAQRNASNPVLEFRTLASADNSVEITATATTVNLKNRSLLVNDPSPTVVPPVFGSLNNITNPLNLNGNEIIGGDVRTTVFGLDVRATNAIIELLLASNAVEINFGTFLDPTGGTGFPNDSGIILDMNGFLVDGFAVEPSVGRYDFGTFV